MNTLDTPTTPNTNTPIWNTVLRYGAYCGAAMVFFSLMIYLLDINMMSISGMLILYGTIFIASFALASMAMRYQRDKLDGGFITYGKALGVGFLVIFLGMLISSVWNYILINFIDPGYVDHMKEQFIAQWGEKMPEAAMEEAMKGFETAGDILVLVKNALVGGVIFGLIVGLITAAFMKRESKPDYMR